MKLGGRILKTGLAVFLAIQLSLSSHLTAPSLAAISAVIAMQPSVYRSWRYMVDQVYANLIGAMISMGLLFYFGHSPILIGVAVILVIMANLSLKFNEDVITLSVITVIVVMEQTKEPVLLFAFQRFSLIMLGVLLAFLVNVILMPPKHGAYLKRKIHELSEKMTMAMRTITDPSLDESHLRHNMQEMKEKLDKIEKVSVLYGEQRQILKRKTFNHAKHRLYFEKMNELLKTELLLFQLIHEYHICKKKEHSEYYQHIQEYANLIGNYHEIILLKLNKQLKAASPHPITEQIKKEREFLFSSFKDLDIIHNDEQSQSEYFHIVSTLMRLTEQLHHIDRIVDSMKKQEQKTHE